jgi:hypothetical protein
MTSVKKATSLADRYGRADARIKKLNAYKEQIRKQLMEEVVVTLKPEQGITIAGIQFFLEVSPVTKDTIVDEKKVFKAFSKKDLLDIVKIQVTALRAKLGDKMADFSREEPGSRKFTAKPIKIRME